MGTEYAILSSFVLRGGYASGGATSGAVAGRLSGMAAGFGLKMHGYSLDYSMSPFGKLGSVQRFSLGARF
ncbi:MAG: hypothetical protein AAB320_07655 [Elusimicrobiota bacterium]